jgi:hypothetical protein
MNTAPQGFFSPQINGMDASSKLPFFPRDFIGVVKVAACKGITTREGKRAFVAELEVVTSNLPETVRVGGKYSWYQDLTEVGTSYPACVSFLYACLGVDPIKDKTKIDTQIKAVQDQYLNAAVNDDPKSCGGKVQILAGALLNLQTSNKVTKKMQKDFTLHNFSPYIAPSA